MHCIAGNKYTGSAAVGLGINKLIVVVDAGQQSGPRLHFVFMRNSLVGKRRLELDTVGPCAIQSVLQRER